MKSTGGLRAAAHMRLEKMSAMPGRSFNPPLVRPSLAACLAAAASFILALLPLAAGAHGGGTPQLTNVAVGPYRVYAWTSPDPWSVGQAHTTVAVTVAAAGGEIPVTDAVVSVAYVPADHPEQAIQMAARAGSGAQASFYEADADLPTLGSWQVKIVVSGPAGSGSAQFGMQVEPTSGFNGWLIALAAAIVLLAAAGVGWRLVQRRTAGAAAPPTRSAE